MMHRANQRNASRTHNGPRPSVGTGASRGTRSIRAAVFGLLTFFLLPGSVHAQRPVTLEIRGGLNYPTGDFGDTPGVGAESVAGFGADVFVPVHPRVSLYVGGGREIFGCNACEGEDEILSTGLEAGAKVHLPVGNGPLTPFLKVGAIYHKADVSIQGIEGDSDWGLGIQAAGGVEIRLGEVLSFSPALRYQRFTATFDPFGIDFLNVDTDVAFLSLDVGMLIRLGGS